MLYMHIVQTDFLQDYFVSRDVMTLFFQMMMMIHRTV